MSADGDGNLRTFEEISGEILRKTFHFLLVKVRLAWYDNLRRCVEEALILADKGQSFWLAITDSVHVMCVKVYCRILELNGRYTT